MCNSFWFLGKVLLFINRKLMMLLFSFYSDWLPFGGAEGCHSGVSWNQGCPHVCHHRYQYVLWILLQLSHHWGLRENLSRSRWIIGCTSSFISLGFILWNILIYIRRVLRNGVKNYVPLHRLLAVSPDHLSVLADYFLEDCIQMTQFVPPPKEKKKKEKDEESGEDDDVCLNFNMKS